MYAVFGVSLKKVRRRAEENTSPFENGVALNVQEWREKVDKKTSALFKTSGLSQLSPLYSNLKEAQQYRSLAQQDQGYNKLIIRKRMQTLDGDGKPVLTKKTRKPILYWEDVTGQEPSA